MEADFPTDEEKSRLNEEIRDLVASEMYGEKLLRMGIGHRSHLCGVITRWAQGKKLRASCGQYVQSIAERMHVSPYEMIYPARYRDLAIQIVLQHSGAYGYDLDRLGLNENDSQLEVDDG
jgi:hypothetical protein